MTASEISNELMALVEVDEEEIFQPRYSPRSFEEGMVLTQDNGFCWKQEDGTRVYVTVQVQRSG